MRVGIAVSEYHRGAGFPRAACDYATGLRDLGHEVTVFAQRRKIATGPGDAGIVFRPYDSVRWPMLLHMATEPWVLGRIFRREAPRFDVIVSVGIPCCAPMVLMGPGTHRGFYERTKRSLGRWSARRWLEAVRPFHRTVLAWERAMLAGGHPQLVLVPDGRRAGEYTDRFGFPRDRIAEVPYAVDREAFRFDPDVRERTRRDLGVPEGVPLLLNVARRGRQKGLDVLATALDRLPSDLEFRAVFAGDGSTSSSLHAATRRLRACGRVRLLGRVPEVHPLYCAADLLVFPSRWDPWGLVVTEAIAAGLPVLCSSEIGAAVAVREGENGSLLRDAEDPDEIVRRLIELLPRVRDLDRDVVARTAEPFGREAVAGQLADALKQVAGSHATAGSGEEGPGPWK